MSRFLPRGSQWIQIAIIGLLTAACSSTGRQIPRCHPQQSRTRHFDSNQRISCPWTCPRRQRRRSSAVLPIRFRWSTETTITSRFVPRREWNNSVRCRDRGRVSKRYCRKCLRPALPSLSLKTSTSYTRLSLQFGMPIRTRSPSSMWRPAGWAEQNPAARSRIPIAGGINRNHRRRKDYPHDRGCQGGCVPKTLRSSIAADSAASNLLCGLVTGWSAGSHTPLHRRRCMSARARPPPKPRHNAMDFRCNQHTSVVWSSHIICAFSLQSESTAACIWRASLHRTVGTALQTDHTVWLSNASHLATRLVPSHAHWSATNSF